LSLSLPAFQVPCPRGVKWDECRDSGRRPTGKTRRRRGLPQPSGSPKCKKRGALEAAVTRLSTVLSIASLAFGVLFYLASVGGLLWGKPTPPLDHGVVPVTAVFVLFGLVGLLLGRGKRVEASQF